MLLTNTNGVICTLQKCITQNLHGFAHIRVKLFTLFPLSWVKVWRKAWQTTHWVIQLHKRQFSNTHAKFPAGIFIIAQWRLAMFQAFYPSSVKTYWNDDKDRGHWLHNIVLSLFLCSLTLQIYVSVWRMGPTRQVRCKLKHKQTSVDMQTHNDDVHYWFREDTQNYPNYVSECQSASLNGVASTTQ